MLERPYYKECLDEELARRLGSNPRYSIRAFAKSLGIDPAALSRILSQKLVPSYKMAQKMIAQLALSPSEQDRFLTSLAQTHQSRNLERMNPALRDCRNGSTGFRELSTDLFRVIADWYHYSILELTHTKSFRPDPTWIASELGISTLEAKLAINRLKELGLLISEKGRLKKADSRITTADKSLTTPALRRRQRQILEKAIESLENDPIHARSNTGMAMAIDPKKLNEAKKMILEFNQKLCAFLETGNRTRVYELAVALFPVQKGGTQ